MNEPFYIDKITECIEEVLTGKEMETEIIPFTEKDLKNILKKDGWKFPWRSFTKIEGRQLYKLVLKNNRESIQGLLGLQIMDNYIEMHHIENAPHNYGENKQYTGTCGNMVAFACEISFDLKFDGFVAFTSKTKLVKHYKESLGAEVIFSSNRMAIPTNAAKNLVNSYYKNDKDVG